MKDATTKTASAASPAPDQGAVERAREFAYTVLEKLEPEMLIVAGSPQNEAFDILRDEFATALTAAAAKAREDAYAAGYREGGEAARKAFATLAENWWKTSPVTPQLRPDHIAIAEAISKRVLATPAPCDHHWVIGNDGVWCTKCNEERSATPAQSEGK
jgi:flagellar biosynthesis/type III secretory pathway protein FliH